MTMRRLLAAATVVAIAFGSVGVAADTAAAATAKHKTHHHHHLVCKKGEAAHLVMIKGKWVWRCHKIIHPILHMLMMPEKH